MFDDDYRQCNITFEQILEDNPNLFNEYINLKERVNKSGGSLYGARGIIYKALFDKFKQKGIFDSIGVLNPEAVEPLVSNARMILNYLNYYTYSTNKNTQKYVSFEKIVEAFKGIIDKTDIDNALQAMFKLGYDSPWNELVAFNEIHSREISDCTGLEVFITKAGHEYLSIIATHFEFFNARVIEKRTIDIPLFSEKSIMKSSSKDYEYNFQETISLVFNFVKKCCERMAKYYRNVIEIKFENKEEYLKSCYTYCESNVLHGERIIHTHIRYIDTYRLFVLHELTDKNEKIKINTILVKAIKEYITVGKEHSEILSSMSTINLFPKFEGKIKIIEDSKYEDFKTRIDV